MAKSIFDRNPITEMFSSIEEAMRCANSKELNNMLRNSFKDITTDPILGKQNKSKESMSITIISGDDLNDLNNINTLENGGKMKKFQYTGRYADGGKNLKPIPADNKGLQTLAKKNPKLVMDMGFDPNSVAGGTKGKKKKGPKVPKNQDVERVPETDVIGDDMSPLNAAKRLYYDYLAGEGAQTDRIIQAGRIFPFGQIFQAAEGITDVIYPFMSDESQAKEDKRRVIQQEASQDLDDYKQYLKDEGKYKTPFETVKGFFGFENGGMAPNLGAYPDIVYLTRFDAGGKQKMARGYQDARVTGALSDVSISLPDGSSYGFENIPADYVEGYGIKYDPSTGIYSSDFMEDKAALDNFQTALNERNTLGQQTDVQNRVSSLYKEEDNQYLKSYKPLSTYPYVPGVIEEEDKLLNTGKDRFELGESAPDFDDVFTSPKDLELYTDQMYMAGSPYRLTEGGAEDVYTGVRQGGEFSKEDLNRVVQARALDPQATKDFSNKEVLGMLDEANTYSGSYRGNQMIYRADDPNLGYSQGGLDNFSSEAFIAVLDRETETLRGTDDRYKTGQQRLDAIKEEVDRANNLGEVEAQKDQEFADLKALFDAGEITQSQFDRRSKVIYGDEGKQERNKQSLPFFREYAQPSSSSASSSSASSSSSRADNKDRSNYPGSVFKSAGLNIRDFQTGEFAGGSADDNRELRRRLQEHLAAGGTPETFSVRQTAATMEAPQLAKIDTSPVRMPEGTMEKVSLSEEEMTPRSRREFRQDNRQDRRADRQATRRANRLERLEGRLETSQQRRDDRQARQDARQVRQDDRQQFKGQVQDLRGQIREARRGGDGMYFNPMFFGGGQMMAGVPTNQNIPNGGQMPPVANFARDGKMINPPAAAQPTGSMNDTINQLRMDVSSGKISAQDAANMMAKMFAAGNK